jgi:hypothetical protein
MKYHGAMDDAAKSELHEISGSLAKRYKIVGDIESPCVPAEEWFLDDLTAATDRPA